MWPPPEEEEERRETFSLLLLPPPLSLPPSAESNLLQSRSTWTQFVVSGLREKNEGRGVQTHTISFFGTGKTFPFLAN